MTEPLPQVASAAPPRRGPAWWALAAACVVMVVVATALRFWASITPLWLDEIWTVFLLEKVRSPLEVFTGIHHDNNHYLNTLYLYFVGRPETWWLYRLHSVAAGAGAVVLAGLIGRRRGRAEAVGSMVLIGFSYLLIHYSSEARGYALLVFFALLAYWAITDYAEHRRWPSAVVFAAASILGFLSHLIFLQFYVAVFVWSLWRFARQRTSWGRAAADLALGHAPPVAFAAALYLVDIRYLAQGGAPPYSLWEVLTAALSLTVGGPEEGTLALVAAGVAVALAVAGIVLLVWQKSDLAIFYGAVILVAPALSLLALRPEALLVRHFILSMVFLLLLAAWVLGRAFRCGVAGKAAWALVLAAFVAVNSLPTARLIEYGRGDYFAALRHMADRTPGQVITLSSNHDFRNAMMLTFYMKFIPGSRGVRYTGMTDPAFPPGGPEWVVVQGLGPDEKAPDFLEDPFGNRYRLEKDYPSVRLSGWRWCVFHNVRATGAK